MCYCFEFNVTNKYQMLSEQQSLIRSYHVNFLYKKNNIYVLNKPSPLLGPTGLLLVQPLQSVLIPVVAL